MITSINVVMCYRKRFSNCKNLKYDSLKHYIELFTEFRIEYCFFITHKYFYMVIKIDFKKIVYYKIVFRTPNCVIGLVYYKNVPLKVFRDHITLNI